MKVDWSVARVFCAFLGGGGGGVLCSCLVIT